MQIPERLTIRLQPAPGDQPPLASVYVRLDLYARGKVLANLSLGLTNADGSLSVARADLETAIARHVAQSKAPAEGLLLDSAVKGRVVIVGGRSFDGLTQLRARLGLDPTEQQWIAQATNAGLASEAADVRLTAEPTSVAVVVASRGGVNSQTRRQHAMSVGSALVASCGLLALRLMGSVPQARFARVVLPLALAWLAYETWWGWRHRARGPRLEAGAA